MVVIPVVTRKKSNSIPEPRGRDPKRPLSLIPELVSHDRVRAWKVNIDRARELGA